MNSPLANSNLTARVSRRAAERVCSELPIEISGAPGLTRNVSTTSVYFETTVTKALGSKVFFVVEVVVKGELLRMVCAGEVVRVEQKIDTVGIAVKLSSSFFTDTNGSDDAADSTNK